MADSRFDVACKTLVNCHRLWLAEDRYLLAKQGHPAYTVKVTANGVQSYEELVHHWLDDWEVVIGCNDCETSPYGVHGNLIIRTAHDRGHLKYGLDFSLPSELALVERMRSELLRFCPMELVSDVAALYWADTVGFQAYHAEHGRFPANQTVFIKQQTAKLGVFL